MLLNLHQAVFILCLLTACSCLGLSNQDTKTITLDHGFSKDHLQSWDDWLAKRSRLGGYPWGIDELSKDKFQTWQDWLYKRRFGGPTSGSDFSGFDKTKFQEWKDYVASKRGLGHGIPFPGFGDFDKSKFQEWKDWDSKRSLNPGASFPDFKDFDRSNFQQWNEWVSKRMFDMKPGSFQPSFAPHNGLQNWAEFIKRQNNFIPPSSDLGISSSPHFQSWHDWVKRVGQDQVEGNNSSNDITKRQLGMNSDHYGSFRRYFTDGLQDWRSTVRGTKRDKTDQKAEQK